MIRAKPTSRKQPKPRDPRLQAEWDMALYAEHRDWSERWFFMAPGVTANNRRVPSGSSYPCSA